MAPWDVANIVEKAKAAGNENIMITERGASFGYNNLVFDIRSLPIIRGMGYPVIFDATHAVQLPGGEGTSSGGQRDMVSIWRGRRWPRVWMAYLWKCTATLKKLYATALIRYIWMNWKNC